MEVVKIGSLTKYILQTRFSERQVVLLAAKTVEEDVLVREGLFLGVIPGDKISSFEKRM
jgi:hypothetical protein